MMVYSRIVASINLNAIQTRVKLSLFKDYIVNSNADIIFCQEVAFRNFSFIYSHIAIVNIGNNQGTAILIRRGLDYSDVICDPSGRIISVKINNINYVNIYGHAGYQYKKERETLFSEDIAIHFNKLGVCHHLVGGDFNCILDANDTKGSTKNYCNSLKTLVTNLDLKDVGKATRGQPVQFSFFRGSSASRIVRFYISENFLKFISSFETTSVPFSDHRAISIKMNVNKDDLGHHYGKGYWKINTAFIDDDFIENEFCFEYESLQNRIAYRNNFYSWWTSHFKSKVKQFYKSKSIEFNRSMTERKSELYKTLVELSNLQNENEDVSTEMNFTKALIFKIENEKLKNMETKLSANSIMKDEKVNIYQIIARHKSSKSRTIVELHDGSNTIRGTNELKRYIFEHFSGNFARQTDDETEDRCDMLEYVTKKLGDNDAEGLIREIGEDELKHVVFSCTKKKTPGPDGISYEFYAKLFDLLKNDMLELFNGLLHGDVIPPSKFCEGYITLIPKSGCSKNISGFRPISLLNCDYKIFAKIIASRIQQVIGKVVGEGQTACVASKSCIENLDQLRTIIAKGNGSKRFKAAIFSLDMEKAFDNVHHGRLWQVLEGYNFPFRLIDCLKNLYRHAVQ